MDNHIIFPIGPGRCGTSLVTGLLYQMGVWVTNGKLKTEAYNPKGFFENVWFKQFLRSIVHARGMPCTTEAWDLPTKSYNNIHFRKQLFDTLRSHDRYPGGPLALKNPHICNVLDTFVRYIPEATYLFVERNEEDTIRSFINKPSHKGVPVEGIAEFVVNANIACREVATLTVKSEDIIAGKTQVLEDLVESVGLEWDADKAAEFIEPKIWHGRHK